MTMWSHPSENEEDIPSLNFMKFNGGIQGGIFKRSDPLIELGGAFDNLEFSVFRDEGIFSQNLELWKGLRRSFSHKFFL